MIDSEIDVSTVLERLDEIVAKNFVNTRGEPVKLAPYQREIVKAILERKKRRILILASTRIGKTESVVVASTLFALLFDGEEVVVVAPRYEQAYGIFKRIRNNFWSNPQLMEAVDLEKGFRAQEIVLKNGSTLRFLNAGGKESLLSWGATLLIVDEFASIPGEILRTRVLRMTGGSGEREPVTVLLGTPHHFEAVADWVYDEDVLTVRISWEEGVKAGILNPEEVDYYRKKLSPEEFEVWFEAKLKPASDAFFDLEKVKAAMVKKKEEVSPKEGLVYVAGVDVARYGSDLTVIVVLGVNHETGVMEVARVYERGRRSLAETGAFLVDLAERWGLEKIAVDTSPLGAGIYDFLKDRLGSKLVSVNMASPTVRTQAYNALRSVLDEGKLVLLDRKDILAQFATFRASYDSYGNLRVRKGRAADDLVDALAVAVVASERRGGRAVALPRIDWL